MRLANTHMIATATDPTNTTSGLLSCADVLLLMYLDVFLFEIVRFCTMLSILACTACGVIVELVSVQVQVHSPARVLLNKVDVDIVDVMVGVLNAVEVMKIVCEDKIVVMVGVLEMMAVVGLDKALEVVGLLKVVAVVGEDKTVVLVVVLKAVEVVEAVDKDKVVVVAGLLEVVGVSCEDKVLVLVSVLVVTKVVG